MLNDMFNKLQTMKQEVDKVKQRLETITVTGVSPGNKVSIEINGNRKVKAVKIDSSLLIGDREELEDLLVIAMNNAIAMADNVNDNEMKVVANGMLPNIKGMF